MVDVRCGNLGVYLCSLYGMQPRRCQLGSRGRQHSLTAWPGPCQNNGNPVGWEYEGRTRTRYPDERNRSMAKPENPYTPATVVPQVRKLRSRAERERTGTFYIEG